MYEDLINLLRAEANNPDSYSEDCKLFIQAADAIEELIKQNQLIQLDCDHAPYVYVHFLIITKEIFANGPALRTSYQSKAIGFPSFRMPLPEPPKK